MFLVLILMVALPVQAGEISEARTIFYQANASYSEEDYKVAVAEYEKVLSMGYESGPLYYNLANAYFKSGSLGKAILNFSRAERLMPNDADLKANLNYARSLIEGGTVQPERKWFARAFFKIAGLFSLDGVTLLCAVLYLVFCGLIILFLLTGGPGRRALLYASGATLCALAFSVSVFAANFDKALMRKEAVVLAGSSEAKFEPLTDATTFFALNEGEGIFIVNIRENWAKIERPDGKRGWVRIEDIEML